MPNYRPIAACAGLAIFMVTACDRLPSDTKRQDTQRLAEPATVILEVPVGKNLASIKGSTWPTDPNTSAPKKYFTVEGRIVVVLTGDSPEKVRGIEVMRCSCSQEGGVIQKALCQFSGNYTYEQLLDKIRASGTALGVSTQEHFKRRMEYLSKEQARNLTVVKVIAGDRLLGEFEMLPLRHESTNTIRGWALSYTVMLEDDRRWNEMKELDEKAWLKYDVKEIQKKR